ncbi:MAG: T9SS type A sorting domain-containing protein [Bacteroidales bacterium]|nr:T9SS type A sorting domain-containing protein [Bacteroidales bacterium]
MNFILNLRMKVVLLSFILVVGGSFTQAQQSTVIDINNSSEIIDENAYIYEEGIFPTNNLNTQDDLLKATISLPGNGLNVIPRDVLVHPTNGKIYVYGSDRLLVLNASTYAVIETHELSAISNFGETIEEQININNQNINLTCKGNTIFLATVKHRLYKIDGTSNNLSLVDDMNLQAPGQIHHHVQLIYDDNYDRLYAVYSSSTSGKFRVYDGTTFQVVKSANYTKCINGLAVSHDGAKYAISIGTYNYVKVYNSPSNSFVATINAPSSGILKFDNNNKLFLFNGIGSNNLTVIDPNLGSIVYTGTMPLNSYTNVVLNTTENKFYCTGTTAYMMSYCIVDVDNMTVSNASSLDGVRAVYYNSTSNTVLLSGYDKIREIDGNTDQVLNNYLTNGSVYTRITRNPTNNQFVCMSYKSGEFSWYNNQMQYVSNLELGANYLQGCYNTRNNKVYYIESLRYNNKSKLKIINGETDQIIKTLELGAKLSSITYYRPTNKVYVSSEYNKEMYIIDGSTNSIISTVAIPNPIQKVIAGDDYIYCVSYPRLYYINATTNQLEGYIHIGDQIEDIAFDFHAKKFYAVSFFDMKLFEVDYTSHTILNTLVVNIPAKHIEFNARAKKLYLATSTQNNNQVKILGSSNLNEIATIYTSGYINNLWNHPTENYISLTFGSSLYSIDGQTNVLKPQLSYVGNYTTVDVLNNQIYCYDVSSDPKLTIYDCINYELSVTIDLGLTGYTSAFWLNLESNLVMNTKNNKLYAANGGYSNVSIIDCHEPRYALNNGWNWLSFPALDRSNDNPVSSTNLLGNMVPMANTIDYLLEDEELHYNNQYWTGDLTTTQSTKGYKLYTNNPTESIISTPGTLLDADQTIVLSPGENWIGYYLPYPTNAWDALAGVVDNLDLIRTKDWTMAKYPTSTKSGISYIWMGTPMTPLKYGDMVIVNATSTCTLAWNNDAPIKTEREMAQATQFSYTETDEYQSIFVELNPEEPILEIGAFVNGECVGAAVVENPEMQEVRAYIPEEVAGSVEFQTFSGNKSTSKMRSDYSVIDTKNRTAYRTPLNLGKGNGVHRISFINKSMEADMDLASDFLVNAGPNPVTDQACFNIQVPEEGKVSLNITDLNGRQLFANNNIMLNAGYNTYKWQGAQNLNAGVYIYKIVYNNQVKTGKLIIK